MRLVGYRAPTGVRVALLVGHGAAADLAGVEEFWQRPALWSRARHRSAEFDVDQVELVPPVRPDARVIGVGLNYRAHAAEGGFRLPEYPTVFGRWTRSLSVTGVPVPVPVDEPGLDWEGELAAVIGSPLREAGEAEAHAGLFAYAVFNDLSARKAQRRGTQWTLGKNADASGPLGPLVTADEVPDIEAGLRLVTRVNEVVVQDTSTRDMIFTPAQVASYLSRTFTLVPGDIICTGTPSGVGHARDPQWFLGPGDTVSVEIEELGLIVTPVIARDTHDPIETTVRSSPRSRRPTADLDPPEGPTVTRTPAAVPATARPGRRTTSPDALGAEEITATVLSQLDAADPRTGRLVASLVTHLHDFIRENEVTWDEWMSGLDFLARVGHWTSENRNEFILMSDTSGCSTLVDALNNRGPATMTPTTVEGPFHSTAPDRAMGDVIAQSDQWARGDWTLMRGRVLDTDGEPVSGARIDIWQADQSGFYDVQDPGMTPGDLRALLTTGADGRYWFRTVKPCPYPVPTDGPGGDWLRATGRQPMRPAHVHAHVEAEGFRPLITHLFVDGDPFLDVDAAFGVRDGLVLPFPVQDDQAEIDVNEMPGPYFDVDYDLVLVREGWVPESG